MKRVLEQRQVISIILFVSREVEACSVLIEKESESGTKFTLDSVAKFVLSKRAHGGASKHYYL